MPRKAALLLAVVLVVAAAAVGLLASAKSPTPEPVSAPAPPERPTRLAPSSAAIDAAFRDLDLVKPSRSKAAEDFALPTLDGGTFRLAEQRGKIVLVNFWATWCPPCVAEMPAMERLWRKQKGAGFVLVAVSVDADPHKVTPFVSEHQLTFPIAFDTKMATAERYGVRALPSSFIIGRDGTLAALALGPRHWDDKASHRLIEAMAR
ncbi:MAG TPA: TlpA disulfide reductase family protein [Vicinamibacterales bacterium]|nr:TlpA disulfide reductase family protein [Vicinamibacterales bacterium]